MGARDREDDEYDLNFLIGFNRLAVIAMEFLLLDNSVLLPDNDFWKMYCLKRKKILAKWNRSTIFDILFCNSGLEYSFTSFGLPHSVFEKE